MPTAWKPASSNVVRAIFEKQPFGERERLVTQKLLDVVKRVAKEELESEGWLRLLGRLSRRSYEDMRVDVLEFLDTDIFNLSAEEFLRDPWLSGGASVEEIDFLKSLRRPRGE